MGFWAEKYHGTGRLTGNTANGPVYTDTGEVAPGWVYYESEEEFYRDFIAGQHDECHTPDNADPTCPYCMADWGN